MIKVDYKRELKQLYVAKEGKPVVVQVPSMNFIMIDGKGNPNTSQEYIDAIQTLYPVAYNIKFMCKREQGVDFGVMPLEGLWWTEKMSDFNPNDKSNWLWTAMIMQPDIVDRNMFERAVQQVAERKSSKLLSKLRFESYNEGRAVQILYIGPYADEGPAIQYIYSFIKEQGGTLDESNKHHHEIYLGDPRRTDSSKLKTIIRQPY